MHTSEDPIPSALPALGNDLEGRTVVITGGTNGVGAALALTLRDRGADVVIIGRSADKARELIRRSDAQATRGRMTSLVSDLSLMRSVHATVDELADEIDHIDILVHAVGVFLSRVEHTAEGVELDFATSYLARFVFTERAAKQSLFGPTTRILSLAATAQSTPRLARVDFSDISALTRLTGLRSHAAAQTANDLFMAAAPARYGVAAMGYGPGNVRTGILRDLPLWLSALIRLFPRREPDAVAEQLAQLIADERWSIQETGWANARGRIAIAPFMADPERQRALLYASEILRERALGAIVA